MFHALEALNEDPAIEAPSTARTGAFRPKAKPRGSKGISSSVQKSSPSARSQNSQTVPTTAGHHHVDNGTNKNQNETSASAEAEPTSVAGIDEENETMKAIRLIQTLQEALNNEKAPEKIFLEQNVEDEVRGGSDVGDADVVNITAIEVLEGNEIVKKSISRSLIDEPSQSHVQIDVPEASVKEKVKKQHPRRRASKKDNEPLPSEFVEEDPSENIIPPTDSCIDTSVLSERFAVKQSIECAHSQGNGTSLNSRGQKRKDIMVKKESPKTQVHQSLENDIQDSPASNTRKKKQKKTQNGASEPAGEVRNARNNTSEPTEEGNEKKKLKKYVPRPKKVERRAVKINPADPDLDLKKMSMRDIIRLAESKDRMLRNDDAKKSNEAASNVTVLEEDVQRTSFAPQVQIIDGRIVINEESLTVSAHPKDDIRTYKRVEETHSKLNYHSYTKRTARVNWQKDETERFYEALSEFGTNFAIIQHLFPGRTRKQIFLKYKKEEKMCPLRVSDALMIKPIVAEYSQYMEVMNLMNLQPTETAEVEASQQDSLSLDSGSIGEEVPEIQSTIYREMVLNTSKASPIHGENIKDEKEAVVLKQPDHFEATKHGETEKLEMKPPDDKLPKCNESPVKEPVVTRKRSLFSYQIK